MTILANMTPAQRAEFLAAGDTSGLLTKDQATAGTGVNASGLVGSAAAQVGALQSGATSIPAQVTAAQAAASIAQALMGGYVFATAALGDAGTPAGKPFVVTGAPGSAILGTLYFQNGSGGLNTGRTVADGFALDALITRLGSDFSAKTLFNGKYSHSFEDKNGNPFLLVERDGGGLNFKFSADAGAGELLPTGTVGKLDKISGWLLPFVDDSGLLYGGFDRTGQFVVSLSERSTVPTSIIQAAIDGLKLLPTNRIVMIGDSYTSLLDQTVLTAALGIEVVDLGVGGQTPLEVAGRVGVIPMTASVTGDQIPASGPVVATAYSEDILYSPTGSGTISATGSFGGVRGTWSGSGGTMTHKSAAYSFTRTNPGDPITVAPNTPFIPDAFDTYRNDIQIWCVGRNRIDYGEILRVANAALDWPTVRLRQVFFRPVPQTSSERSDSSGTNLTSYQAIKKVSALLAFNLGDRFIDDCGRLVAMAQDCAADLGITLTTNDLAAIAADAPPFSFFLDGLHLTQPVYNWIMTNIHAPRLKAQAYYLKG